ncbi:DUF3951 domain-containing protein [Rossellomorea vietnamensis]|uniref:DUF3951 domain-containing protein n=1 Tax=Rossellomorea vietnamensis TaxID=218284 RepID=UPI001CCB416A|nr:DUF3951 domain-containing protein [Rossellomorea vietnamensis]MCA0147186.1 DUF3951 domain-containing protein [Rossellomorea vietnamensis]
MFYLTSTIVWVFVLLILLVAYRVLIKKKNPSNYYTPFDHIKGQSVSEFQEENIEDEQEEEEGNDSADDKDKN